MIKLALENIKPDNLIIRGSKLNKVINEMSFLSPKTKVQTFGLEKPLKISVQLIESLPNDSLIYAIGNQVGAGQEILKLLSKLRAND